jgi:hypothetical protein
MRYFVCLLSINYLRPIILEIIQKIKDMGVKTLILSFGADTAKGIII